MFKKKGQIDRSVRVAAPEPRKPFTGKEPLDRVVDARSAQTVKTAEAKIETKRVESRTSVIGTVAGYTMSCLGMVIGLTDTLVTSTFIMGLPGAVFSSAKPMIALGVALIAVGYGLYKVGENKIEASRKSGELKGPKD